MKRYLTKKVSGYFTVEAALLLPIIIMIIVFMIFLSFYCYDRCILEQCAYAAALRGSSNRFTSTQEAYEEAAGAAEAAGSSPRPCFKHTSNWVIISVYSSVPSSPLVEILAR